MKRVLEAASKTPSYTNTQPWGVAVAMGKKRNDLSTILCNLANAGVKPNPDLPSPKGWSIELEGRAREHGARRFKALGIERENEQQRKELHLLNFKFYQAPCVLFLFMDSILTSWSIFDVGLFAHGLILAAYSLGLGSYLQASLADYPDAVREYLGILKTKLLVLGISIGYPDLEAPINTYRSSGVSLDTFVQWYA